ncbi:MAG: helix-turn-helix transcriptional regulator [Acidimicrobiia bacterium]
MPEFKLLEREHLLAVLMSKVDEARQGLGSLVLIAGEAGAGKTSLTKAFIDRVGRDALVLEGACDPLTTPRPLSPLLDFASDPDSGLADLFEQGRDNVEVFNSVLLRLRNTIRPVVMVIEDVHWADQGTLDFLRFIGRRVGDSKAVVVCTYRDDEVGADHPLRPVLGQLLPLESTVRLVVPPLSPEAVTRLAAGSSLDPRQLYRITGGNAFYVTEVIAGGEQVPATVQDAVIARLSRLDHGPRDVVEAVAVAPRSLGVDQAMQLVGGVARDVDRAVSSGVLLSDGKNLHFRHELGRSAVEASIPPARRFALHRRMIALLLEDEPPDLARLAHHAIETLQADLIVEYAPVAAEQASMRGAHKEAVAFYEAALRHSDAMDTTQQMELRLTLATELGIIDRNDDARAQCEIVITHYRGRGETVSLAKALIALSSSLWRIADRTGSRAAIDEAITILHPLGPGIELARALFSSSYFHMLARQAEPALADNYEARTLAETSDDESLKWNIQMIRGTIEIVLGDPQLGAEMLTASKKQAAAVNSHRGVGAALGMLGSGGGEARIYEQAIPALNEGIDIGLATDHDYTVAYSRSWLARIAFEQGRWDEAVSYAELVDRTSLSRSGIAVLTAKGALGRVRIRRGDPGGRMALEDAVQLGAPHELQHIWSPICGLAEYHWLSGDVAGMVPVLAGAYERALDTDSAWARGELGYWMWKAGSIDGPPPRAAEPFALQMGGKWREAAKTWDEIGCPYEVALALSEGDQKAMLEALGIFDSLGARPAGNMVRAALRELGVDSVPRGPSRETAANPANLTSRQLEVLRLVASGMTNAEIANTLFLSQKTVEHHVSAIYAKLGVATRPKAIAEATRIGVGGQGQV